MYYNSYSNCDMANGDGVRVSLFVSGCSLKCKGCFAQKAWDPKFGQEFNEEAKTKLLNDLGKSYVSGLSLLGGDPLEDCNIEEVTALCKEVKEKYPDKTIWLWTGRTQSKIKDLPIMEYLDVVISEPFVEKLKCSGTYFGSSNQKMWVGKTGDTFTPNSPLSSKHAVKDYYDVNDLVPNVKSKSSDSCCDL